MIEGRGRGGDDGHGAGHDAEVGPGLFTGKCPAEVLHDKQEVHVEVNAEQQAEHRGDGLQVRRICRKAVVGDGESSRSRSAEGDAESVKYRHSRQNQHNDLHDRHGKVDLVEDHGRGLDLRKHTLHAGTRALRLHQVHVGTPGQRKQTQDKYQYAHASDPMGKASPEQNAVGQGFHLRQNTGSRGGKSGRCLKYRIHRVLNRPGKQKWQGSRKAQHNPAERNRRHTLRRIVDLPLRLSQHQRHADHKADQHRQKKSDNLPLSVNHGDQAGQRHESCLEDADPPENIENNGIIHLVSAPIPPEYP